MKTKIAGILYLILFSIVALLYILVFIVSVRFGVTVSAIVFLLASIVSVFFGYWALMLADHRKWAWNLGVVLLPIIVILSSISFATGLYSSQQSAVQLIVIFVSILNIFTLYTLVAEKNLFITNSQSISVPPTPAVPIYRSVGSKIVKVSLIFFAVVLLIILGIIILFRMGY